MCFLEKMVLESAISWVRDDSGQKGVLAVERQSDSERKYV